MPICNHKETSSEELVEVPTFLWAGPVCGNDDQSLELQGAVTKNLRIKQSLQKGELRDGEKLGPEVTG